MNNFIDNIKAFLLLVFEFLRTQMIYFVFIAAFAGILWGTGWWLMRGTHTKAPQTKIQQTIMQDRLFVNVLQDSIQQLVKNKGGEYSKPGIFRNKASITIPIGLDKESMKMKAELDSLASVYSDELEVETDEENIKMLCPTIQQADMVYVNMPVIVILNLLVKQ